MLENELYPTPSEVRSKIRQEIKISLGHKTRVFDPSAGNGALLDDMKNSYSWHGIKPRNLYAAEIDMELRYILQSKGYRVLASDFLGYSEPQKFDLVLMNPPFSNGCAHVLHAWDFVAPSGQLIALINSETLRNPYSKERQLLAEIIRSYGHTKELGQCFRHSERPTNVEVLMIVLMKPQAPKGQFSGFEGVRFEDSADVKDEEFAANPLAHSNLIKALVSQYQAAEKALVAKHEANKALDFYCSGITGGIYDSELKGGSELTEPRSLEEQLQILKARFWATVFEKSKLGAKATSSFRDKFNDFAQGQGRMAFNESNVLELFMVFFGSQDQIMQDCLVSVFDRACSYDEKNKIHWEGWKTNDAWKVNKRVILPYGVEYSAWGSFSVNNLMRKTESGWEGCADFLNDLDKVMCFLSGVDFDGIKPASRALNQHIDSLYKDRSLSHDRKIESTFFLTRIFKKGTVHIEFRDLDLLAEFNRRAAIGKKWVPDESTATQQRNRKRKAGKLLIV